MPELPPEIEDSLRDSVHPQSRAAWRAWLEHNHATEPGVWFVFDKKAAGGPRVTYAEAVEEALCFGWVDSVPRKLDAARYLLRFTPRKKGSGWAKPNKERVERLTRDGRMAPAGLAKVEAAKADGSWTALDDVEALVVPPDLEAALAANADAERLFRAFPPSARKAVLTWIAAAKRPETRARRIAEAVAQAARNVRAYP